MKVTARMLRDAASQVRGAKGYGNPEFTAKVVAEMSALMGAANSILPKLADKASKGALCGDGGKAEAIYYAVKAANEELAKALDE